MINANHDFNSGLRFSTFFRKNYFMSLWEQVAAALVTKGSTEPQVLEEEKTHEEFRD